MHAHSLLEALLQISLALAANLILKFGVILHNVPIVLLHLPEALLSVGQVETGKLEHTNVLLVRITRLKRIHHVNVGLNFLRQARVPAGGPGWLAWLLAPRSWFNLGIGRPSRMWLRYLMP